MLGAGVLINPEVLLKEISDYSLEGRVGIDYRATVIKPEQIQRDRSSEHLSKVIQSTGSGHGPALADRALRIGKLAQDIDQLRPYLTDVAEELNDGLDRDESVLVEGTNGFLLSVLYGTYPHTVAKDSTASTVAADVGLSPLRVDDVVLVFNTNPSDLMKSVIQKLHQEKIYEKIFLIEHQGKMENTSFRIETIEQGLYIEKLQEENYRQFGYEVIKVPFHSIQSRANIIFSNL